MRTNLSFRLFYAIFIVGILSFRAFAQDDMKPPAPINNATFNMLMGTWKSDPYDMMGSKWSETADHKMMHNGQFMFITIDGSDDKGVTYSGTVIATADKDGNVTGWAFDNWGTVTTYTGKTNGNKMTVSGKSSWGTETRDIEINGNTMVHKMSWTMKGKDGNDMNMSQTITYHKQ